MTHKLSHKSNFKKASLESDAGVTCSLTVKRDSYQLKILAHETDNINSYEIKKSQYYKPKNHIVCVFVCMYAHLI